jgi:hypothetical protein
MVGKYLNAGDGFPGEGNRMTGRAVRIASAVLLALLVPLTANAASEVPVLATHVAAVLDTAGSTGSQVNHTGITQRDANVAADKNTSNVPTGGSFICAAGAVVPAQITT